MKSNRKVILMLFIALFITSTFAMTRSVHAATIDVYPGAGTPLQTAINGAGIGDTIHAHAGIYKEVITISKKLIVLGDGAATTTITGAGLAGPVVTIDSSIATRDVSFVGFTITGAPVDGNGESFGMLAKQTVPTAGVTYTISNCTFVGTNNPASSGEFQFYASGGQEAVVFTGNVITKYSGNAILVEVHTGPTEISYNNIDAPLCNVVGKEADVIFFMTYGGVPGDVNTLQNICYNTFNMGTAALKSTAVSIAAPGPGSGQGNSKFTNIVITGNRFKDLQANGRAIGFWNGHGPAYPPENVAQDNIISPSVTKNWINGLGLAGSYGISFYDDQGSTTGAFISCNIIKGVAVGIYLRAGDAPGTTIVNNDIVVNTLGVDWLLGVLPVTATNNWWGSITGPFNAATNPGGLGNPVTNNVNYNPWLLAEPPCVPPYTLTVSSARDSPYPSVGPHDGYPAGLVTAWVTSPVTVGLTEYVCTGWTGTGSVPASGSGTAVTFTITQDSSITWNWMEHATWLGPAVGGEWAPITMQALTPMNMLQLLAPWIALALIAAATALATYRRLLKKHW
jgi:hypothetical protein